MAGLVVSVEADFHGVSMVVAFVAAVVDRLGSECRLFFLLWDSTLSEHLLGGLSGWFGGSGMGTAWDQN